MPMIVEEGRYDRRLEIIKDLPRASVIWFFDQTDMANAKAVLGDTACIVCNMQPPCSLRARAKTSRHTTANSLRSAAREVALSLPGVRVLIEGNRIICTL